MNTATTQNQSKLSPPDSSLSSAEWALPDSNSSPPDSSLPTASLWSDSLPLSSTSSSPLMLLLSLFLPVSISLSSADTSSGSSPSRTYYCSAECRSSTPPLAEIPHLTNDTAIISWGTPSQALTTHIATVSYRARFLFPDLVNYPCPFSSHSSHCWRTFDFIERFHDTSHG